MLVCLSVKMLYILVLCPVLLAAAVQTLTIDSQLGTSIEDCFERISIGEQLPPDAIYRNVTELTTRECEHICKQDKQCQSYDYGVGAKGNATCNLGKNDEKTIKEKNLLLRHPDYDVYVRRFQCEQSPPSPIPPQFDDPSDGPVHRPVFRPVDDQKSPLADDYLLSGDLEAYGVSRPVYKPQYDERPDDFTNQKPDNDMGPSYGAHKPQDIPYRPQNTPYKPQDATYRPSKPNQNTSHRPDPYDVLQFQDPYRPNDRPGYPNNDYNRPARPPNVPEKPDYIYIIRPNRKPKPQPDTGYNKPGNDYPVRPGYGQADPGYAPGPVGPKPYPNKDPYDRPRPGYQGPTSGYGQTSPYEDNSIHVEITDPHRPYRPAKPTYGQGIYGYGTYSSQNSYTQSQNSHSHYYGSGSISDIGYGTSPYRPDPKPERPGYGEPTDTGYGGSKPQKPGYGDAPYRPDPKPERPGYGEPADTGYGVSSKPQKPNYDNQPYRPGPRPERPGYGEPSDTGYGTKPQKPSYGNNPYRPDPKPERPGYDEPSDAGYGSAKPPKPSYIDKPSYGDEKPSYGNDKPSYGNEKPSYGNDKPSYGNDKPSYGNEKPSYGNDKPSYGNEKPSYGNDKPSYGNDKPSYGNDRPSYGMQKPTYDVKPSYGNEKPSYNPPLYGSNGQDHSSNKPYGNQDSGYGLQKPSDYNKPLYGGYGTSQASYGANGNDQSYGGYGGSSSQASYGSQGAYEGSYGSQSTYGSTQGSHGTSGSYGSTQNYGSTQTSQSSSSNYGAQGSYGSQTDHGVSYGSQSFGSNAYGGSSGSYGTQNDYNRPQGSRPQDSGYGKPQKPKPSYENDDASPGYGNSPSNDENRPDFPEASYGESEKPGYNEPTTSGYNRPSIKPVYEDELDKPANVPSYIARPGGEVVTSRPMAISDYGEAYGRNPEKETYKACFRRVLAGQRALRSHVRKVVPCERLEDCRRECAIEKRFHCESFNYRLDHSFRGKGLCELMTKPIEAFDLRRDFVEDKDFDFFELDRNSLEPNCPETLKGPGILHSGFLSSKTNRIPDGEDAQSGWRDRYDNFDGRNRERFGEDRRNGNKRFDDRFFVPYRINQGLARSDDDQENWGQYGGVYGGFDHYKDRNDYHKSIDHWRLASDAERPSYGVKQISNTNFDYQSLGKNRESWSGHRYGSWKRGRWNNSGSSGSSNGLDYGESTFYKPKSHIFEQIDRSDDGNAKDCSSRRRPGMSLGSGAIRRSLIARNVVECEAACFSEREFKCVSYSYRYSNSHGSDNCFLSERPYRGLEMSADSSSDVYAMPQDQGCVTINYKPWVESECFWHVRSGAAVSDAAVRAALTVAGLGACEAECIRAHAFFCRGFSFRFDSPKIGDDLENCILTSSPPTSLESGRGVRPNSGHELYARGNYGRGCEPALYDDTQHRDEECYLQYDKAAKLTGSAIRGQARVKDEQACGHACNDAPFRCLSFSFNNNAPPNTDNCLLSEIRLFDLQRGVDYEHSSHDWLFAFDLFNGQCWRKVHTHYDEPAPEIPRPLSAPPVEDPYSVSGPSGPPTTGLSGPSGPSAPSGPEYDHHDPPYISSSGPPSGPGSKPYPRPESYKPGYSDPSAPGYKPNYSASDSHKPYPEPSGPDFKPGYSGPSGPSYKPDYPGPIGPSFKPAYTPPVIITNIKDYPSGPGSYKPGYLPEPDVKPFRPQRPVFRPNDPGFGPDKPGYLPEKPGYLPDRRPGYPGQKRPFQDVSRPSRPGGKPGLPDREVNEPSSVSWRHYTVSGFPCRARSVCAQNTVAGHWACEPEGGEIGSWDYCCSPTHRCGYSEGFHKPWCYVGPNEDQWRPCSEKYYPYHQHKVPHPSQTQHDTAHQGSGYRENLPIRPERPQPWQGRPGYPERNRPSRLPGAPGPPGPPGPPGTGLQGPVGPYLSEGDRKYWDDLYKNGPQAYYDKYGNPLPGYSRVPTESRPHIKLSHNSPPPGSGTWLPVAPSEGADGPPPNGLGVPRYWPVAYLHKEPPPNTTYFRYNETQEPTTTTERYTTTALPTTQQSKQDNQERHRDEKKRNISDFDEVPEITTVKVIPTTTPLPEVKEVVTENVTEVEIVKPESVKIKDTIPGIDDKIDDFSSSIEVIDLEDVKGDKLSELKMLEAEERQIEEIGRILASRRGGKLVLDKRSEKDLESKHIAIDKDMLDFNFGNRFNIERRGVIQKVSKDEIERERVDKSLEVSETSFVRPPRVLSTTENIRKAIVNGKVFYDATIREQRDIYLTNSTRKSKSLRHADDSKITNLASTASFGKKIVKARNVNPVRRVRRVYRKRYNPEEVRRRLLEREKSKIETSTDISKKI